MDDLSDIAEMDDPDLIAERARVRNEMDSAPSAALTKSYQRLNDEFDRRATAAWKEAT
ncbi:MAG: hypothetical protein M3Z75_16470 [Actinomycetota bacterium]|nr:hypothetical protein [Actinomycetota bacterium]